MKKSLVLLLMLFDCTCVYAAMPTDPVRQQAIDDALTAAETSMNSSSPDSDGISAPQAWPNQSENDAPSINGSNEKNNSPTNPAQPQKMPHYPKHKTDLAFQAESFHLETGDKWPYYYSNLYSVSDKVKKSGELYGFYGSETLHFYGPLHTWGDLWKNYEVPNFMRVEVEASKGSTDYSSYATGKLSGFDAWEIDGRLLAGYDYTWNDNTIFTPYLGFGYRRFTDKAGGWVDYFVNNYAAYTYVNTYYYLPVGVETLTPLNDQWDMNFKLEGDIIVDGTVDYDLNEIPGTFPGYDVNTGAPLELSPRKATSDLDGGFGFRTSLKFVRKYKNYEFYVEPFFKYLYLKKSDAVQAHSYAVNNGGNYVSVYPDKSAYKPLWDEKNHTIVLGVRTGIQF